MTKREFKTVYGRLTDEQKQEHREIRKHFETHKNEFVAAGRAKMAEMRMIRDAMLLLKAERIKRGLILSEVAERAQIEPDQLRELETDPQPNPSMHMLTRIADALGVKLNITVESI